jgi:hypothetical protein
MQWVAAALAGVLVGAAALRGGEALWRAAAESDAERRGPGIEDQLMRRKADALQEVLDALVRDRLDRIEPAAERMAAYTEAIEGFLATDVYRRYGDEYRRALIELRDAAGRDDRNATRAAFARLENSCLECHFLIGPR